MSNRIKLVYISGTFLTRIMESGIHKLHYSAKGLPEGTKFMYAITDHNHNGIGLVFEHESFALVKDGDLIPTLENIGKNI